MVGVAMCVKITDELHPTTQKNKAQLTETILHRGLRYRKHKKYTYRRQ